MNPDLNWPVYLPKNISTMKMILATNKWAAISTASYMIQNLIMYNCGIRILNQPGTTYEGRSGH